MIDDPEEKKYIYQGISRRVEGNINLKEKKAVISYIGTGSLGIAVSKNNNIVSSQNIRVGSLKLSEILRGIQDALEKAHEQKLDKIETNIDNNIFIVTAITNNITFLEKWTFNQKSNLFEEVFGIKTKFQKKTSAID